MDWKNNKTVQISVAVAAILIVIYLGFSGDASSLFFASTASMEDLNLRYELGSGEEVPRSTIVWTIAGDILARIGSILISVAIAGFTAAKVGVQSFFQKQAVVAPSGQQPVSIDAAAQDIVRAVALNDMAEFAKLSKIVRQPYAQQEALAALQSGDFELAKKRVAELEAMATEKAKV